MTRMIAMVAVLAMAWPATAETLESVEKRLVEAFSKHKSVVADMTVQMVTGGTMEGELLGKFEYVNTDGKERTRQDLIMQMQIGGQTATQEMQSLFDGKYHYSFMEMGGQQIVRKQMRDSLQGRIGGKSMFEGMRKEYKIELLPKAVVDGKETVVIQTTRLRPDPQTPYKFKLFFNEKLGVIVRLRGENDTGQAIMTGTFTNVKIGVKLDPKRFEFVLPENAQLIDMTVKPGG